MQAAALRHCARPDRAARPLEARRVADLAEGQGRLVLLGWALGGAMEKCGAYWVRWRNAQQHEKEVWLTQGEACWFLTVYVL